MNQPNYILKELEALSPVLAAIPRCNVFKVPQGYFEQLPAQMLQQITDTASVPEGYFTHLASQIMARIKQEALTEGEANSAIIDAIGNKNIFSTPAGNFDALPQAIVSRIKTAEEQSTLLSNIGNKNVWSVPAGYFANNVASILQATAEADVRLETRLISGTVAGIGNANVFTVPRGYFEQLPQSIQQKKAAPARLVKMGMRTRLMKYAAAAVITGLLASAGIWIYNSKMSSGTSPQLKALMAEAKQINKTDSFDKELNSIGDAEIVNYLSSKGQDVDAALVASLADDEKKLPDAADYIIDESTLDNMLKELELIN